MTKRNIRAETLFVDLDDTLVACDTLIESILIFIKNNPIKTIYLFYWLLKGKAFFKDRIEKNVSLNGATLPYNNEVLDYVRAERSKGRKIVLATAANYRIADSISKYLALFDDVIASDSKINLKGENKLHAIRKYVGNEGFDYIGDSNADIPIFKVANKAIIFNPSTSLTITFRDEDNVLFLKKKK